MNESTKMPTEGFTPSSEVRARGNWVLIQKDPEEVVTEVGLVIPKSESINRVTWGTVLSVGPGIDDLEEGDRVCWPGFTGQAHRDDDETIFLKNEDIIGEA